MLKKLKEEEVQKRRGFSNLMDHLEALIPLLQGKQRPYFLTRDHV